LPIYEYGCEKCGAVTDIRHGFNEKTSEVCPVCGGPLARRFNPAGIVFKGSGFYVNDSRKSSGASSEGSSASTESKGESSKGESSKSDSSKSESAPSETKSEPKSGGDTKPAAKKSETAA